VRMITRGLMINSNSDNTIKVYGRVIATLTIHTWQGTPSD
jgi:hypothetical protein